VRAAAVLAFLTFGALAAAATAAPLTVQVVNQRGVEQASRVTDSSGTRSTTGHGRVMLDVEAGEHISATRGAMTPEGAAGVSYTVPNPVPSAPVQLTLPSLPDAVAPAHDANEAWMLARVNDERAALGRAPLRQSGSLNRAADVYARHLLATGQFSHLALFDPWVRVVDQGWPVPGGGGVGEVLALAPSKESALTAWKQSPGHWTLLMGPGADVTGVGVAGNRWVMTPSTCGATDAPERCEIGQSGERPPAGPPAGAPPVEGQPAAALKRARLRVKVRRQGNRVFVRVRLVEGRGVLRVAVRQGARRARVRAWRRGRLLRARAILAGGGRCKVTVRFEGGPGWADRRLVRLRSK
jgi:uncharacterized protein YkwD